MRKEYDFSGMKGRRNPYAKQLKKQITIRLGVDVLEYFKDLAAETRRICSIGDITPAAWMQQAVAGPLSATPLVEDCTAAIKALGE